MSRPFTGAIAIATTALFVLASASDVAAKKPESVFGGKVLILKRRPPSHFKTSGSFIQFLRSNSVSTVYANEDNEWEFETFAFFKRPLGDYEVDMVFYDVTNGSSEKDRKFADSYVQYTQDRNTRALAGKARLTRPSFDANRKYMVVVQSKGKEVAKGFFTTKGVTQDALDQQARIDYEVKKMEESMKELQQKAKEQEEALKKQEEQNKKASDDLF